MELVTGQIQPPRSDPKNPFNSLNKEVTLLKAVPLAIKVMMIFILNQELIALGLKPRVDLQTQRLWQCYRATDVPLEQGRGKFKWAETPHHLAFLGSSVFKVKGGDLQPGLSAGSCINCGTN